MDSTQHAMEIVFRGTRGSYPVPGETTLVYGGNTACNSIKVGGRTLIIDTGTGIINLGRELAKEQGSQRIALFISHNHLDHTSGILYFVPTYNKTTRMYIYGPEDGHGTTQGILQQLSLPPAHPVPLEVMGMQYTCETIRDGDRVVWRPDAEGPVILAPDAEVGPEDVVVKVLHNPHHPVHGVLNFRVEYHGKSYVYATDVEGDVDKGDAKLAAFASGCDLLVHDGQYSDADYVARHRGWGHSTPTMAVKTALMAGVKQLGLIHFEPAYADTKLAEMEAETRKLFPNSFFAREGQIIVL